MSRRVMVKFMEGPYNGQVKAHEFIATVELGEQVIQYSQFDRSAQSLVMGSYQYCGLWDGHAVFVWNKA